MENYAILDRQEGFAMSTKSTEMELIYPMTIPREKETQGLYILGENIRCSTEGIVINKNETMDFGTYFNCFSVRKWCDYTSLTAVRISFAMVGQVKAEIYAIEANGKSRLQVIEAQDDFVYDMPLTEFLKNGIEVIGIELTALSEKLRFIRGGYYGSFATCQGVSIGIVICTFKRERYVKHNVDVLKKLINENDKFSVMIIDNGRTLTDVSGKNIQVIPNPNYGGSGGFTRGLMEQVNQGRNNYVLMMDDDIVIENSALERVYKVCQHVREERKMQMFGGAMLNMQKPTEQFENTAYWNLIKLIALGRGFDLTDKGKLYENEKFPEKINTYAAWWFCCIPMGVIQQNGYPLPVFIKSDDMEYSIRNNQPVMTMNGVGVWHETFEKKVNPAINYFNDRNMLILNHFAAGCGRWTFLLAVMGRLFRRLYHRDGIGVRNFEIALRDHGAGFEGITRIGADEKFAEIRSYVYDKKIMVSFFNTLRMGICQFMRYGTIHKKYLIFRKEKLADQTFWRHYLRLE